MNSSHTQARRRSWWQWWRGTPRDATPTPVPEGAVIATRGLRKIYGHGEAAVHALEEIDLDVYRGTFTAVMGPSGSGKSTLMHVMAGLDTATEGSVVVDRRELTWMEDAELTEVRRDRIGFIFQSFNLVPTLTARQNILLPASIAGRRIDPDRLATIVDAVGLADRLDHRPSELSGGQQQRVATARALVGEPAVIFADEPTGNLDSQSTTEVLRLLRTSVDTLGQTVVMVTHEPDAAAWADRVLFLVDGHIVRDLNLPTRDTILATLGELGRGSVSPRGDTVDVESVYADIAEVSGDPNLPNIDEALAAVARQDYSAPTPIVLPRRLHSDDNPRTQEIALIAVERVRAADAAAARAAAADDLRVELGGEALQDALERLSPPHELSEESAELVDRAEQILGHLPGRIMPDDD